MSSTSRITPIHGGAVAAILKLLDSQKLMTLAVNRADGRPQAATSCSSRPPGCRAATS